MGELCGNTNKKVLGFVKSLNYVVEQTSPFEQNEVESSNILLQSCIKSFTINKS